MFLFSFYHYCYYYISSLKINKKNFQKHYLGSLTPSFLLFFLFFVFHHVYANFFMQHCHDINDLSFRQLFTMKSRSDKIMKFCRKTLGWPKSWPVFLLAFSCEFWEIFQNKFFINHPEHLRMTVFTENIKPSEWIRCKVEIFTLLMQIWKSPYMFVFMNTMHIFILYAYKNNTLKISHS